MFDQHPGFHLHVLSEPGPRQDDCQAVTADQLSPSVSDCANARDVVSGVGLLSIVENESFRRREWGQSFLADTIDGAIGFSDPIARVRRR